MGTTARVIFIIKMIAIIIVINVTSTELIVEFIVEGLQPKIIEIIIKTIVIVAIIAVAYNTKATL